MFLHDFIMKWLLESIGNRPDYWVRERATSWYEKGILAVEDLQLIDEEIDKTHPTPETIEDESEVEE